MRGHPPPHCENTQVLSEAITEDEDDLHDQTDALCLHLKLQRSTLCIELYAKAVLTRKERRGILPMIRTQKC